MSGKINKNGKGYPLGFMPQHYPADRVYLDGDTSKTVQDAITWTRVDSTLGNTPINLPTEWRELIIEVNMDGNVTDSFSLHVCKEQITTFKEYKLGYYYASNYYFSATVRIRSTDNDVTLKGAYSTGTDKLSTTVISVFAR